MKRLAMDLDAPVILSAAENTDLMTQRLLDHLGATPVPITLRRWPILEQVN
jgi:hypothetical protein